jgi:hypothetical protein
MVYTKIYLFKFFISATQTHSTASILYIQEIEWDDVSNYDRFQSYLMNKTEHDLKLSLFFYIPNIYEEHSEFEKNDDNIDLAAKSLVSILMQTRFMFYSPWVV